MPRVPMPEGPQFQPGGNAPQGRLAAPEASDIGQRQVMALGGAMQEFGASVGGIARDMQAQADELRITDALNQYKERALTLQHDKDAGYLRVRGKDTFDRPDGKSLTEFYGGQLANAAGDIAGTLGNDRQRAAFMKHASDILTTFRGGVQEHEAREYQTYQLSVAEGVQSTALRDIELNWNNPQAVDAAVQRIQAEVYRTAQLTGNSAEWQEAQARKMTSNAHKVGLVAALDQGDVAYADDYLKRYSKQMDGDDILSVKGRITKEADEQVGASVATEYVSRAVPRMSPSDFDRVVGITIQTESGGNPNAVSPVGARGLMQVMPETAKAPGFGIKPSDGSQADDVRVGRELLAAHIKQYGGDLGKAWAAYNAGQKWVDAAVARAGKAPPGSREADWFWQLNNDERTPANRRQTQDYVNKNMAAFNAGGGGGPRPTFADVDAQLRADPRLAGSPERLKIARQEAQRQFSESEKAIQQRGDEAVAESMRQIMANGGRFTELPPALRSAIPPDKVSGVLDFAAKWARGEVVNDQKTWAMVLDIPPAVLSRMSKSEFLATYGDKLDPAHLEKGYALLDAAASGGDSKHTEIVSLAQRIKGAAREAGFWPAKDKVATEENIKAYAQFEFVIDKRVREFERIDLGGKRKANTEEVQKIIDAEVTNKVKVRGWGRDPEKPLGVVAKDDLKSTYVVVSDAQGGSVEVSLSAIPADVRAAIVAARRKAGLPVTEQSIAQYWVNSGRPSSLKPAQIPAGISGERKQPAYMQIPR